MTDFRARHYQTGRRVRVSLDGSTIARVEAVRDDDPPSPDDDWVAPAFWDIQTNGRWGISFSDPTLTPEQVAEVVRAQDALGTARLCPTLITAPFESFRQGLKAIVAACEADPEVDRRVIGVHLEGPYISPVDGFRGAHPLDAVRAPDWDEFQQFQEASGGRVVLMTLAPEHHGAIAFIEKAVASGVTIALGHTAADGPTLRSAVDAGATLSTHLGNGIAATLPRHPNPIWEQAALDGLSASLIADGHHLDPSTLKVLVRAKTPARVILVSDASPLAGLPPGTYGNWAVDPSGKIVVAGTPYLAGSNQQLEVGLNTLMDAAGVSLDEAVAAVTRHPAHLLGHPEPRIEPGEPADLILFSFDPGGDSKPPRFRLRQTWVAGRWAVAGPAEPSSSVRPVV
jgi:N-acetylglucosamine-6-phosphate deacetylase